MRWTLLNAAEWNSVKGIGQLTLFSTYRYRCSVTKSCPTLCNPIDCSPNRLLCPQDFPGKNTGVGCHFLLQGIFLTQGSNPCLLHCRWILYH